jgi:2,3-bisphosphoglycerate-independent phosphoglycerate mutase
VPFIVKDFSGANHFALAGVEGGGLSNVAASLLTLLGYEKPADYDVSLVKLA